MAEGCFELPGRSERAAVDLPCLVTDAARAAGIVLNTRCAGQGTCGGCAVDLLAGQFVVDGREVTIEPGTRKRVLGCKTVIVSDAWRVRVPRRSLVETGLRVLEEFELPGEVRVDPLIRKYAVRLPPPTLDDSVGDFERICRVLRKDHGFDNIRPSLQVVQKLPELVTQADYNLTVTLGHNYGLWEMIQVEAGDTSDRLFAVAADIGTTTVVCSLVDLVTGEIIDSVSSYNQQVQRCDDVASRIIYADQPERLKELQRLVIDETLNRLLALLCRNNKVRPDEIARMVVSGNTIMGHLLLGVNPRNMGGVPFQPGINYPGTFRAAPLGLAINPAGFVDLVPSVSAYVGGDITSDAYVVSLYDCDGLTVVVDVGTNAEIFVSDGDRMLASATPAGPAYEGGGLTCGLRACDGAIEAVRIDPQTFRAECRVIGGIKPSGVCGSGLIDFLGEARRVGLIDRAGKLSPQLRETCSYVRRRGDGTLGGFEYVLVPSEQVDDGQTDLVITEKDIEQLLQAKAVIFSGITILLNRLGKSYQDVQRIYLAGAFAKHIDLANAIAIGMLPDLPLDRYRIVGNASLAGAYLGAVDAAAWAGFDRIVRKPEIVELNKDPEFEDEFACALFLPNLLTERFPTVMEQLGQ
ncbi:MAG TPA: ASKHA domain-containing protein [Phycisphaerae bacterium]|nr:ASKHA domain-containing protein [Phycisphaerae bacterium]